ncbi:uncharacterized protein LOC122790284 [Protopterus annectens]|uniref:uncharacterized protein LOC122790284 n=1 Tax=Protopterus annectens TaxID=7888 RepID=UPI001CFC015B|nr:uncharacterized protein LOC122790284 [Protopterus annectens]
MGVTHGEKNENNVLTKEDGKLEFHENGHSEPQHATWNNLGMEVQERQMGQTFEPDFPQLEESDFLPSVRLAFFLLLVFTVVSYFLADCSSNPAVPLNHTSFKLHSCQLRECKRNEQRFLFPSQTEATWRTLDEALNHYHRMASSNSRLGLIVIGQGQARNTVFCFSKTILSLLVMTEHSTFHEVKTKILDYSNSLLSWNSSQEIAKQMITIAIILQRARHSPYGLSVCLQHSSDGNPLVLKTVTAMLPNNLETSEECFLQNIASALVSQISIIMRHTATAKSNISVIESESLSILFVKPEDSLEHGFSC